MKKEKKNEIIIALIICFICIVFFSIMFMQFKTVEETDITAIENMRETELRSAISEWKSKYEDTQKQLEVNQKSILEYREKVEKNEEASELIDKDLEETNMLLGKTDVIGEGIIITLADTQEYSVTYHHLIELVNELRYAGAEAISINDARVVMTEIVDIEGRISVSGQRLTSPYVVKVIGNQTYLSSTLSLKDKGFIDRYQASGMNIKLEKSNNVKILKYSGDVNVKYMKEVVNK